MHAALRSLDEGEPLRRAGKQLLPRQEVHSRAFCTCGTFPEHLAVAGTPPVEHLQPQIVTRDAPGEGQPVSLWPDSYCSLDGVHELMLQLFKGETGDMDASTRADPNAAAPLSLPGIWCGVSSIHMGFLCVRSCLTVSILLLQKERSQRASCPAWDGQHVFRSTHTSGLPFPNGMGVSLAASWKQHRWLGLRRDLLKGGLVSRRANSSDLMRHAN